MQNNSLGHSDGKLIDFTKLPNFGETVLGNLVAVATGMLPGFALPLIGNMK